MEPSTEPGAAPLADAPRATIQNDRPAAPGAPERVEVVHTTPAIAAGTDAKPAQRRSQITLSTRDRLLFYLMAGIIHVLSLIPDFLLYPLGIAGGFIGYCLDRRHIPIGMKNLAIAFPERSEAERRRILRASYINLGRGAAEFIRLGGFFYRRLKGRVGYERFAYWAEVNGRYPGRGSIILSAHFGNFELLAPAHAMHGFKISLVHHTQRFLAGDALITFV